MLPSQWPALGPAVDFSSLDSTTGSRSGYAGGSDPYSAAAPPDGVVRPWWTCGTGAASGGGYGTSPNTNATDPFGLTSGSGSIAGLLNGIMSALQQFAATLTQGGTSGGTSGASSSGCGQAASRQRWSNPGPEQRFADVDVSSTGDPHIAEVGTAEGPGGDQSVNAHWDSMSSHGDLVHTDQVAGGYRVSTSVTQPDANGVTYNQSASVRTANGRDSVTMNRDGSYSISENGQPVSLAKGQSTTLPGGTTVSANADGSLTVSASNARGGSIATTLRSTGTGVDVTSHAHEIALGGDAISHQIAQPVRD